MVIKHIAIEEKTHQRFMRYKYLLGARSQDETLNSLLQIVTEIKTANEVEE